MHSKNVVLLTHSFSPSHPAPSSYCILCLVHVSVPDHRRWRRAVVDQQQGSTRLECLTDPHPVGPDERHRRTRDIFVRCELTYLEIANFFLCTAQEWRYICEAAVAAKSGAMLHSHTHITFTASVCVLNQRAQQSVLCGVDAWGCTAN